MAVYLFENGHEIYKYDVDSATTKTINSSAYDDYASCARIGQIIYCTGMSMNIYNPSSTTVIGYDFVRGILKTCSAF